ncbi:probable RNA methyltransferase CG11342 isoform X2 [Armigeres subalbatus]|uniref:probable RNA methyltransferase CG11342 isoform X2 n=1 Tax=Armigeres subalbatus TaxID=124917 RepID=UPI002ED2E121
MSENSQKRQHSKQNVPNDKIRHGNYHQYYEFRPTDSREQDIGKLLSEYVCMPTSGRYAENIHILDIGCNSGKLTHGLQNVFQMTFQSNQVNVLGVDLDQALVDNATENYGSQFLKFGHADISAVSCGAGTNQIRAYMDEKVINRFDFVCCFSVLMYVHLNHGDDGLRCVLEYICSISEVLLLELQSWKKYRDQVHKLKREGRGTYEFYDGLQWRGGDGSLENLIWNYVISRGFSKVCTTQQKNEFQRDVVVFARNIDE